VIITGPTALNVDFVSAAMCQALNTSCGYYALCVVLLQIMGLHPQDRPY